MENKLTMFSYIGAIFIEGSVFPGFIVPPMDLIFTSSHARRTYVGSKKNKIQLYMGYSEHTITYLHTLGTERYLCFLRYYECEQNNYQNLCILVVLLLEIVNMCWTISFHCCVSVLQTKF